MLLIVIIALIGAVLWLCAVHCQLQERVDAVERRLALIRVAAPEQLDGHGRRGPNPRWAHRFRRFPLA